MQDTCNAKYNNYEYSQKREVLCQIVSKYGRRVWGEDEENRKIFFTVSLSSYTTTVDYEKEFGVIS
jgi:hypothetical protein